MRIGLSTFNCDHGKSGVGLYVAALAKQLLLHTDNTIEFFGEEFDRYTYIPENDKIPFQSIPIRETLFAQQLWHLFQFNSFVKKRKYDAVLFPAVPLNFPLFLSFPTVIVVNSIVSESAQKTNFVKNLQKAKKLIAATQFIRKDLISLGIDQNKIEVIYNGIDHNLFFPHEINTDFVQIKPFAIKKPYILYPSRISYPEKKHLELVTAFTLFKKQTGLPHRLVLAGADGMQSEIIHEAILKSPYGIDIVLTGFFPHDQLTDLYACADACIFPAQAEGVGLPVMEAMATGVPVCCANTGALPEVSGNNAVFFNPNDASQMAETIETIICDKPLREKLIASGLEWTKRFSWEKTMQKTIDVLLSCTNKKNIQ